MIEREKKRAKIVEKYAAKRAALKAAGDYEGLSKLPANASPTRLHNRCNLLVVLTAICANSVSAVLRSVNWRTKGQIPGVKKPAGNIRREEVLDYGNDRSYRGYAYAHP